MMNIFKPQIQKKRRTTGFTIIELIIVIILMGIVGSVAVSRYVSGSSFNASGARDAIITVANATQQASLGRDNMSFEIDAVGSSWVFSAIGGSPTVTVRSLSIPSKNVILETGSAVASGNTCVNSFDTAVVNDFALSYNRKGDLTSFTNNATVQPVDALFNGVRICINDNAAFSMCVSPAGYAFEGDCVD